MISQDDTDKDITLENQSEEDVAPSSAFGFLKTKKLTSEESASHAVVNALKSRLDEYVKEVAILRRKEADYQELRVTFARLEEKFKVYSKASIFWDIVLVLCPLAIGYILSKEYANTVGGLIVIVSFVFLIISALISRYFGFSNKERSDSKKK